MTLTDAGPLTALVNRNDPFHAICTDSTRKLPRSPLLTTWPCFTEAMYLLHRAGGWAAQSGLWTLKDSGRLVLHEATDAEIARMHESMSKYRDVPMDLADASLMAAAERIGRRRIFTLDRDFHIYRFADGGAVEVMP